jgi:hypothetical protein
VDLHDGGSMCVAWWQTPLGTEAVALPRLFWLVTLLHDDEALVQPWKHCDSPERLETVPSSTVNNRSGKQPSNPYLDSAFSSDSVSRIISSLYKHLDGILSIIPISYNGSATTKTHQASLDCQQVSPHFSNLIIFQDLNPPQRRDSNKNNFICPRTRH